VSPVRFLVAPQTGETFRSRFFFIHLCEVKITRPRFVRTINALGKALSNQLGTRRYVLLTDETVGEVCLPLLSEFIGFNAPIDIIEVESGEACKAPEVCMQLWSHLLQLGITKSDVLVCLGGGSVTDLGGFIGATYKRGVSVVFIPTTVLAMTDAAIGGKNGIDFEGVKNAVGTIIQPESVLVYTGFKDTLTELQYLSGFAEIVKHGIIGGNPLWEDLAKCINKGRFLDERLLRKSVDVKLKIVSKDPFEKGDRRLLNVGHTIGHAIESAFMNNDQSIEHGIAVAMGMQVELKLSQHLKLINERDASSITKVIQEWFGDVLPPYPNWDQIEAFLMHDKKTNSKKILLPLPISFGHVEIIDFGQWKTMKVVYSQFVI
jgi:3-dehydroquinate synthase